MAPAAASLAKDVEAGVLQETGYSYHSHLGETIGGSNVHVSPRKGILAVIKAASPKDAVERGVERRSVAASPEPGASSPTQTDQLLPFRDPAGGVALTAAAAADSCNTQHKDIENAHVETCNMLIRVQHKVNEAAAGASSDEMDGAARVHVSYSDEEYGPDSCSEEDWWEEYGPDSCSEEDWWEGESGSGEEEEEEKGADTSLQPCSSPGLRECPLNTRVVLVDGELRILLPDTEVA